MVMYLHGTYGPDAPKNDVRAITLLEKVSQRGTYPRSAHSLGVCYHEGQGVQKDVSKAVKYFEQAAQHRFGDSCLRLAVMPFKGDEVAANPQHAVELLMRGAQRGYHQGCIDFLRYLQEQMKKPQAQ